MSPLSCCTPGTWSASCSRVRTPLVPSQPCSARTDEDIKHLRGHHPFLADFSDAFICNTPVGDLMKIETTSLKIREVERAKDACNKLAANKAALSSIFSNVEAGTDNRWNKLHPARFLAGGAGCSATKLWLSAREVVGLKG